MTEIIYVMDRQPAGKAQYIEYRDLSNDKHNKREIYHSSIRGVRTRAVWIGVLAGRTLDWDQMNTDAEYQYMIRSDMERKRRVRQMLKSNYANVVETNIELRQYS